MDRNKIIILCLFAALDVAGYLVLTVLMGQGGKVTVLVKVHRTYGGIVQGARVDLYNTSLTRGDVKNDSLIATSYSDEDGVAKLENIPLGGLMSVQVTKEGYSSLLKNISEADKAGGLIDAYLLSAPGTNPQAKSIRVTVRDLNSYRYSDYAPVTGARVELYVYDKTTSEYTLLDTEYTDYNGVVDFGELSIDAGKIYVKKEGYTDYTGYFSSSSRNINADLWKKYSSNTGESLIVTVKTYSNTGGAVSIPITGASVNVYNKTSANNYTLVLANYTDSNGVVNFGITNIESGKVEVSKEGYMKNVWFFSADFVRDTTIFLTERQPMTVYVSGSGSYTNYSGISEAKVELYNKSNGIYVLVKTAYSDSNGAAEFGKIEMNDVKIVASKNGYYKSTKLTPYTISVVMLLTEVVGNSSTDYPLTEAEGNGCINPNKQGAPPGWAIGSPDGKGVCFWESEPIFGTFGISLKISMLNLTVSPNSVSVNKPLEVLTSNSETCYDEALINDFSSYSHYATFVPDVADSFKDYVVREGTVSARCIAVKDLTSDGYGYYIDSIEVYH